jgi:periplasmic mercuric ion binding protein
VLLYLAIFYFNSSTIQNISIYFNSLKLIIMKTIKFFSAAIIAVMLTASMIGRTPANSSAPATKTESFKVLGACDMCKTRIENGLKLEGVTKAVWDEKSRLVTVTYDPAKTSIDNMQKKLASIGHDTEKYKAPDDVYAKLPACCHYERGK